VAPPDPASSLSGPSSRVADGAVAAEPLLEHSLEERDLAVYVVVDADLGLAGMEAVEPSGVLDQRALPRHWHGEEQGVESRVGTLALLGRRPVVGIVRVRPGHIRVQVTNEALDRLFALDLELSPPVLDRRPGGSGTPAHLGVGRQVIATVATTGGNRPLTSRPCSPRHNPLKTKRGFESRGWSHHYRARCNAGESRLVQVAWAIAGRGHPSSGAVLHVPRPGDDAKLCRDLRSVDLEVEQTGACRALRAGVPGSLPALHCCEILNGVSRACGVGS
jgi:hypothetical protein